MIIQDSLEAKLTIGGVNYDLSPNTFESICISQNVLQFLPSCRLILDDTMGFFDQIPLVDGLPVLIQMTSLRGDEQQPKIYPFVLTGRPEVKSIPTGKIYILYGLYDRLNYIRNRGYECWSGTSNDVLKQVAKKFDFTFDGDDTADDSMDWYMGIKSYGQFAQSVSDFGYFDSNSCAMVCVTPSGKMKYKNVTNLPLSDTKDRPYFFSANPKEKGRNIKITQDEWFYESTFVNLLYGYTYDVIDTSINGNTKVFSKIDAKKTFSNKLNVNLNINSLMDSVRTEYGFVDCGNTHPNYWKAYHQNKRLRCMYSTTYIPTVIEDTGLELLDLAEIENVNVDEVNPDESTIFIVAGKTQMISDDLTYKEKLQLTTTGKNIKSPNLY